MFRNRSTQPVATNISFAELVEASNFSSVNDAFEPEYDSRWTDKGDRVRGEFTLINMGQRNYRETDLAAKLEHKSRRSRKKLRLATAYELVYYAAAEWNRSDWIVAFGSVFASLNGSRRIPYMWSDGRERELDLSWGDYYWSGRGLVLCISE